MAIGSPTKARELDDPLRLQILEHLIAGKTIVETAELVGIHRTKVETAASMYGHPRVARMEWSRDLLREAVAAAAAPPKPTPQEAAPDVPARDVPAARLLTAVPSPAPKPPPAPKVQPTRDPIEPKIAQAPTSDPPAPVERERPEQPEPARKFALDALDALDALVARGRASDVARTREVAEQLIETAAVLIYRLGEERPADFAPAAAPAASTVGLEVFVKPPVRGNSAGRAAHVREVADRLGVTVKDIRSWAAEQGLSGHNAPVLRQSIVDAYEVSRG